MPLENLLQGKYENLTILLQRYLALDKTCSHCRITISLLSDAATHLSSHLEVAHGNASIVDKPLLGNLLCAIDDLKVSLMKYVSIDSQI